MGSQQKRQRSRAAVADESAAPDHLAEVARTALARGDWVAARAAFEALVDLEPTGEALFGLGDVLWWLGETVSAVAFQERAYAAFQHGADPANAAMAAIGLYLTHRVSLGSAAVARGWLARAARLVEEHQLAPLEGWVALLRAHDSADSAAAERWASEARASARQFGDIDLELCALSQHGVALIRQGRVADGTTLLDEAMAAGLAGEAHRPHTSVYVCCNLISSCAQSAEFEQAVQWIRASDVFEQRYGNAHLYTTCRTYLGAILFATGDWAAAERELRAALDLGAVAEPDLAAEAAARLAELRLAQGSIEEAERLLDGFDDHPSCTAVLAALALTRGDRPSARRLARRLARARVDTDLRWDDRYRPGLSAPLEEAAVWELLASAADGGEAESALEHLTALAETTGCRQIRARAMRTAGRLRGELLEVERALALFLELRLVFEAARTRLALSELLTGDEAIAEARAALAVFEGLGAGRDADAAAARLRALGVTAVRGGPTGLGALSQREQEVLNLLGEGLTNREVGDRLFLSRKTVERHVRNVLVKLGLRNRAEAAAFVARHGQELRSTD